MTVSPTDLPNFLAPPVVEVSAGLKLEPLPELSQAHLGLLWSLVKETYPRAEDQPRLEIPIEVVQSGQWLPVQFELIGLQPMRRTWLVSGDDTSLLQVQDDLMLFNWRQRGDSEYPRFGAVRDGFWRGFRALQKVMTESSLPAPAARQVEVTYFNWIGSVEVPNFLRISQDAQLSVNGVGEPDSQRLLITYPVSRDENVVGRLNVEIRPGQRAIGGQLASGYQMSLNFRAPTPTDVPSDNDIEDLFTLGHDVIVNAFADLTPQTMHLEWRRER